MKICIVTQHVIKGNGQGRVNYEVTRQAIQRGHYVTLLATSIAPEFQDHKQVKWIPISVKAWGPQLIRDWVFAHKTTKWLNQNRSELDLVAVNGGITWAKGDIDFVHFVHNAWQKSPVHKSLGRKDLYGLYQQLYTFFHTHWEKRVLSQAEMVVAVSKKVGEELSDIGLPSSKMRVIVNGVDLHEFSPGKCQRTTWNLPESVPLALFAGDIKTFRKNLDSVLHALVQVPTLHLVVVGSTEGSPFPSLAQQLGVIDRVYFLGYRSDIANIMRAVDLFVFPSRYEACTLVLLEALATGLPVITATSTGGAELVTPDCGVVLTDSEDVEALAQALKMLADDPSICKKMGQAARAIAEQHSWQNMADCYIQLFEGVNQCNQKSL